MRPLLLIWALILMLQDLDVALIVASHITTGKPRLRFLRRNSTQLSIGTRSQTRRERNNGVLRELLVICLVARVAGRSGQGRGLVARQWRGQLNNSSPRGLEAASTVQDASAPLLCLACRCPPPHPHLNHPHHRRHKHHPYHYFLQLFLLSICNITSTF